MICDPIYKHPMICCCCGRMTELDLRTGLRVLCSTGKIHYVCKNLLTYLEQLMRENRNNKYVRFEIFKDLIIKVHDVVN